MFVLSREQILSLVQRVVETEPDGLDCDCVLDLLTEYATQLARGDTSVLDDSLLISDHLSRCSDCREEFEMMRGIITEGYLEP